MRRVLFGVLMVVAMLVTLAGPARAGGWATLTLDSVPSEVYAGEPLAVGFMLRQHGTHPTHEAWGEPLRPILRAWNEETGAKVEAEAKADEEEGHFTVEVTFPEAGVWQWELDPVALEGRMKYEALTVLPIRAASTEEATVAGVAETSSATTRGVMRGAGLLLLLLAGSVAWARKR